jgi:hypothetical protein
MIETCYWDIFPTMLLEIITGVFIIPLTVLCSTFVLQNEDWLISNEWVLRQL